MSASSGISRGGKLSGEGGGAAPSLEEKKAQRIKCPFKIPDRGDCDGSFGRGIDVRQHIMHDHAELRLVCECGGKFTTQFAYKRHRQGIHKNNPEQVPPAQLSGMKCCNFQFENANDLFHHILDQQHVLPTRENRRLLKVTASRTVGKSSAALTYSSLPGQPSAPSTSSLYGSTSQRIQQGSTVAAVTVPSFQNLPMRAGYMGYEESTASGSSLAGSRDSVPPPAHYTLRGTSVYLEPGDAFDIWNADTQRPTSSANPFGHHNSMLTNVSYKNAEARQSNPNFYASNSQYVPPVPSASSPSARSQTQNHAGTGNSSFNVFWIQPNPLQSTPVSSATVTEHSSRRYASTGLTDTIQPRNFTQWQAVEDVSFQLPSSAQAGLGSHPYPQINLTSGTMAPGSGLSPQSARDALSARRQSGSSSQPVPAHSPSPPRDRVESGPQFRASQAHHIIVNQPSYAPHTVSPAGISQRSTFGQVYNASSSSATSQSFPEYCASSSRAQPQRARRSGNPTLGKRNAPPGSNRRQSAQASRHALATHGTQTRMYLPRKDPQHSAPSFSKKANAISPGPVFIAPQSIPSRTTPSAARPSSRQNPGSPGASAGSSSTRRISSVSTALPAERFRHSSEPENEPRGKQVMTSQIQGGPGIQSLGASVLPSPNNQPRARAQSTSPKPSPRAPPESSRSDVRNGGSSPTRDYSSRRQSTGSHDPRDENLTDLNYVTTKYGDCWHEGKFDDLSVKVDFPEYGDVR